MNNVLIIENLLSLLTEKNFIDSFKIKSNKDVYNFDYTCGNKIFSLQMRDNDDNYIFINNNEVVYLKNAKIDTVFRLITEKVSLTHFVLSKPVLSSVQNFGWETIKSPAVVYPVGFVKDGVVYKDANNRQYIHCEEGLLSLGLWKLFFDKGEENYMLSLPNLKIYKGNENFKAKINSALTLKELLEYDYSKYTDNSFLDLVDKQYYIKNRLSLPVSAYINYNTACFSCEDLQKDLEEKTSYWNMISNEISFVKKLPVVNQKNPDICVVSGSSLNGDWKFRFSFRYSLNPNSPVLANEDYILRLSDGKVNDFLQILSSCNVKVFSGSVSKIKETVITNKNVNSKLLLLCKSKGDKQEQPKIDKKSQKVKCGFFAKLLDIDKKANLVYSLYQYGKNPEKILFSSLKEKFNLPDTFRRFDKIKVLEF